MRLLATIELPRRPSGVACTPNGDVLVLSSSNDGAFLDAYDATLSLMWSVRLEGHALRLDLAADGTPWVLDRGGVTAFGERGIRTARVNVPKHKRMRAAAFAFVDDDVVFALEHDGGPVRPPVLTRVSHEGNVRWATTLPIGTIAYEGVVQMRADENWRPRPLDPWTPTTWFAASKKLDISGDAVLASFSEMPRSGIGFGYVLSLGDGALRFITQKGPIHELAPLENGAFLVGYQGYGARETLRYTRDGTVATRWSRHGYYLVGPKDIRVIELENSLPSTMHITRLEADGSVTKGAWLDGYYTSVPHVQADGTAIFFRKGTLFAVRDLAIDERLVLCAPDDMTISTAIVAGNESVYFAFQRGWEASPAPRLTRIGL